MIYIVTVIASLVLTFSTLISETISGNIAHIKNGREPNAGAAIFPSFPVIPLFFCFIAWMIDKFLPAFSLMIVIVGFTVLIGLSIRKGRMLQHQLDQLMEKPDKS